MLIKKLFIALASLAGIGVIASPTPNTENDVKPDSAGRATLPTLHITNFSAYISTTNATPSHISLQIVDPRPDYFVNTTCTLRTDATTPDIYKIDGWWPCEDFATQTFWWVEEDWVRLRRVWQDEPWNPRSKVIGVSGRHATNWLENRMMFPGNKTTDRNGKHYSRTTDWAIPIETILV